MLVAGEVPIATVRIRADVGYDDIDPQDAADSMKVTHATIGVLKLFSKDVVRPYVGAGVGAHRYRSSNHGTIARKAVYLAGGLEMVLTQRAVSVEMRVTSPGGGPGKVYLPSHATILFNWKRLF